MNFPENFLIGAATAAHQVEGNNAHSDCWALENIKHTDYLEKSGLAVDHYNRFEEDIRLLAQAGLNAYRFTIEWARIESEEGKFDEKEIEHYRNVIRACKKNNVEPMVTLHHFSSPVWLIRKGGWEATTTPDDFARYVEYVISKLGSELTYVCTINEANMGLQIAAIAKRYMKEMLRGGKKKKQNTDGQVQMGMNLETMLKNMALAKKEKLEVVGTKDPKVFQSMRTANGDLLIMKAHTKARDVIRRLAPHIKVGLTLSLHDVQPFAGGEKQAQKIWAEEFTHYLPYINDDDFLGVQNYTRTLVAKSGDIGVPEGAQTTQMSYEFYPEALGHVLERVAKDFKHDLIVTENGIATNDDTERCEFIRRAMRSVDECLKKGLPVKGYFHWSLMDNFEWQKGFYMHFGLIAVDRKDMSRHPKESLSLLGSYNKH
jgi:beta-glucosidase